MSAAGLLVQQFVVAVARLTSPGTSQAAPLVVPSFGDVDAAVREQFKMTATDREALVAAVRKAAWRKRPDEVDTALNALVEGHAQELVAKQQTAFLIGMEVGRTGGGGGKISSEPLSGSDENSRSSR